MACLHQFSCSQQLSHTSPPSVAAMYREEEILNDLMADYELFFYIAVIYYDIVYFPRVLLCYIIMDIVYSFLECF